MRTRSIELHAIRIGEHAHCVFERDAMLAKVALGLRLVPLIHEVNVTTKSGGVKRMA
jgi:hypothetical protein